MTETLVALIVIAMALPAAEAFGSFSVPLRKNTFRANTARPFGPALTRRMRMQHSSSDASTMAFERDAPTLQTKGGGYETTRADWKDENNRIINMVSMDADKDEGAREREKGGGVAVKTRVPDGKTESELEIKPSVEFKGNWRVLLHRDEWITFDYCEGYLIHIVPTLTRKKAHQIAMEAHMKGTATVIVTFKKLARYYSLHLQKAGFTSSITPDRQ